MNTRRVLRVLALVPTIYWAYSFALYYDGEQEKTVNIIRNDTCEKICISTCSTITFTKVPYFNPEDNVVKGKTFKYRTQSSTLLYKTIETPSDESVDDNKDDANNAMPTRDFKYNKNSPKRLIVLSKGEHHGDTKYIPLDQYTIKKLPPPCEQFYQVTVRTCDLVRATHTVTLLAFLHRVEKQKEYKNENLQYLIYLLPRPCCNTFNNAIYP